ncbi:dienelactone hydrolase, partial [Trichoderma arundinaceum]
MPLATAYDPASPNEVAPPLPSAPPVTIGPSSELQPPLSRRGSGPGLIILLPGGFNATFGNPDTLPEGVAKPLDPLPVQKWAEEGFAVVAITLPEDEMELTGDDATFSDVLNQIREAAEALKAHPSVDIKDRFGLVVHEEAIIRALLLDSDRLKEDGIACVVSFSNAPPDVPSDMPVMAHTCIPQIPEAEQLNGATPNMKIHCYPSTTPQFVFPYSMAYNTAFAGSAHTRNLVFLRKHLGGPTFDLEAIWEEHCYWEFEGRSVARTMATMVAEPYVNHVPTMTGGIGREKLTAFYRDHFIFCNPPDTKLQPVSRTVGPDRII